MHVSRMRINYLLQRRPRRRLYSVLQAYQGLEDEDKLPREEEEKKNSPRLRPEDFGIAALEARGIAAGVSVGMVARAERRQVLTTMTMTSST